MSTMDAKNAFNPVLGSARNEDLEGRSGHAIKDSLNEYFYYPQCRTFVQGVYDNNIIYLLFIFSSDLDRIEDQGAELLLKCDSPSHYIPFITRYYTHGQLG